MVEALSSIGYANFRIGNYPKALDSYKKGLDLAEKANYKAGAIAYLLLRTGYIYHDNGDLIMAMSLLPKKFEDF